MRAVLGQEPVGLPVERMTDVRAEVLVGIDVAVLAHDETFERPVAFADPEFPASRIRQIIKSTNHNLAHDYAGSSFQGATLNSSSIPGTAHAAQNRKKLVQPIASTMTPVTAFANTLGTCLLYTSPSPRD